MDSDATETNLEGIIKLDDEGNFECVECENQGKAKTSGEESMVEADIDDIREELEEYPKKLIYGACSECGMEYQFKILKGEVVLVPSDEEK